MQTLHVWMLTQMTDAFMRILPVLKERKELILLTLCVKEKQKYMYHCGKTLNGDFFYPTQDNSWKD